MKNDIRIISVTPDNLHEQGIYCIKDKKAPGYAAKRAWLEREYPRGLRLLIARNAEGEQLGFLEYTRGEAAWRPVEAPGHFFIHCLFTYPNKHRGLGVATSLLEACKEHARKEKRQGLAVMSSKGAWMADRKVFEKNGFRKIEKQDRFELLWLPLSENAEAPHLINWREQLPQYKGWHLLYADQCPWHEKAAEALLNTALDAGIHLEVHHLESAEEARRAPSGFAVFNLIRDGRLLEDHYISATRFKNILKKEGV